jgi:hypothetical protein
MILMMENDITLKEITGTWIALWRDTYGKGSSKEEAIQNIRDRLFAESSSNRYYSFTERECTFYFAEKYLQR